jgi:glycosyltransferase involved in cell wall biosynthesis/tetratricopeptide (TPR) repeat protein
MAERAVSEPVRVEAPDFAPVARSLRRMYADGKAEYAKRSFEAAERIFLELLEVDRENSGAWYYVGRSRYERSDLLGAISALKKSVKYDSASNNPVTWLGKACRRAGLFPSAVGLPEAPPASMDDSGRSIEDVGRERTIGLSKHAVVALPSEEEGGAAKGDGKPEVTPPVEHSNDPSNDAALQLRLGRLYQDAGDFENAIKWFWAARQLEDPQNLSCRHYASSLQRLLLADPSAVNRWLKRAGRLAENVDIAAKLESGGHFLESAYVRQSLFAVTGRAEHCRATVQLLERAGQIDEAVLLLGAILKENPDKKWLYQLYIDLCASHERLSEGLRAASDGIERFPRERPLLARLARLLARLGRWEESAQIWKRIASLEPSNIEWRIKAADSLRRGRKDAEAVVEYVAALEIDARHKVALKGVAQSLRRVGDHDKAIEILRTLVEVAPSDKSSWDDFVYASARAERLVEARAALAQAASNLGNSAESSIALARMAERAMLYEEAADFLTGAMSDRPDSPDLHAEFARYFLRQGNAGRALDTFLNARPLQPVRQDFVAEIDRVRAMQALLGQEVGSYETTVPEDAIRWIAKRRSTLQSEEFVKGRVSILCTQMGSGGAERQAAITAVGLCKTIESVAFHCLSLDRALGHDFYLPLIADQPIKRLTPAQKGLGPLLLHDCNRPIADVLRLLPEDLAFAVAAWHIELRLQRPEVVHAWQDFASIAGALAAILAGVPTIVLSTRNTRPENRYRRWKRYLGPAYQEFEKTAGIILSNNSTAGAIDYEDWLELPRDTVKVVYNGVDFSDLERALAVPDRPDIRKQLNIPAGAPVVGGVFRLSGEKQPFVWLEAAEIVARKYENCHFVLCGGGTLRRDIEKWVEQAGLADRIHIVGVQSPIAVWYEIMDILVLSSRNEGLPNVLLEAQYLGIPVVASEVGGVREVMVPGISGWPVPDVTGEKLAERVMWILQNPDWARQAGVAARNHIKSNFSLDIMYANTLRLYGLR